MTAVYTAVLLTAAAVMGVLALALTASGRPLKRRRAPSRLHRLGTALRRAGQAAGDGVFRAVLAVRVWRHRELAPLPARDENTVALFVEMNTGPMLSALARARATVDGLTAVLNRCGCGRLAGHVGWCEPPCPDADYTLYADDTAWHDFTALRGA